jgi:hypothetical protein
MLIRDAEPEDWHAIWPFMRAIVAAGETFSWPRDIDERDAREIWYPGPPGRTVVAVGDGTIVGTASSVANHMGRRRESRARAS